MRRFALATLLVSLPFITSCAHKTVLYGVQGGQKGQGDYYADENGWRCYSPKFEREVMQVKINKARNPQ